MEGPTMSCTRFYSGIGALLLAQPLEVVAL